MGVWAELKAGVRDVAIGLQYMGREHVTKEDIEAAQRELDRDWQPDIDEQPQDWNDLREEQREGWENEGPDLGYRYMPDGTITTHDGGELDIGWSPGTKANPEMPERELGE
jgi:hypothetical protein